MQRSKLNCWHGIAWEKIQIPNQKPARRQNFRQNKCCMHCAFNLDNLMLRVFGILGNAATTQLSKTTFWHSKSIPTYYDPFLIRVLEAFFFCLGIFYGNIYGNIQPTTDIQKSSTLPSPVPCALCALPLLRKNASYLNNQSPSRPR